MNNLDIMLLSVILVCFAAGLKSGLIKQVFSIVSVVGGLVLGFVFYPAVGAWMVESGIVADPKIASIAGFVFVASGTYLFIQVLSYLLGDMVTKLRLSWINNLLGGTLGAVVGVLLCHLLITGILRFMDEDSPFIRNSLLAPKIVVGYAIIKENIPEKLDEPLEKLREYRNEDRRTSGSE